MFRNKSMGQWLNSKWSSKQINQFEKKIKIDEKYKKNVLGVLCRHSLRTHLKFSLPVGHMLTGLIFQQLLKFIFIIRYI